ncbi:MAG: hypothetical protein KatS3mg014_2438 [Actinomycetota bacterium]|nr:MAG: hypothetical protein KatS3mg014_2438 [Actinomycetota bacterium]
MARAILAATLVLGACAPHTRTVRHVEVRTDPRLAAELREMDAQLAAARAEADALRRRVAELERASRSRAGGGSRPAVRPSPGAPPCGGWEHLVARHPWDVATACRILWCESRGDPAARNGRHVGLFQIADGPADPAGNVALAASMWSRRGWQPWAASRRCWGGAR